MPRKLAHKSYEDFAATPKPNLKVWMEAARTEPVKITRKSGEAFVLVNADTFEKMQIDLARLEGLAAGLLDAAQGRTKPSSEKSTSTALARAKSRALSKGSNKK